MKNPFRRKTTSDFVQKRDALSKKYGVLLEKAQILAEVERCQELLWDDYFEDQRLPPEHTAARQVAEKKLEKRRIAKHKECLRGIIFAVPDVTLRCEIITCHRKLQEIALNASTRALWEAHRRRKTTFLEVLPIAMAGGAAVLVAWSLAGAMWGSAIGVSAVILGLNRAEHVSRQVLEKTNSDILNLEEEINETYERGVFDGYEENTGETLEKLSESAK